MHQCSSLFIYLEIRKTIEDRAVSITTEMAMSVKVIINEQKFKSKQFDKNYDQITNAGV